MGAGFLISKPPLPGQLLNKRDLQQIIISKSILLPRVGCLIILVPTGTRVSRGLLSLFPYWK